MSDKNNDFFHTTEPLPSSSAPVSNWTNKSKYEPEVDTAISDLKWALFFFAVGCFVFGYIWYKETSEDSFSIHWILAILYSLGGKWAAGGILAGIGALFAISGIRKWRKGTC